MGRGFYRFLGVGFLLGALLTVPIVDATGSVSVYPFQATINPASSVNLTGLLLTGPGAFSAEVFPGSSQGDEENPIFLAARAEVRIVETRWQTVETNPESLPLGLQDIDYSASNSEESYDLIRPRLYITSTMDTSHWTTSGTWTEGNVTVSTTMDCQVLNPSTYWLTVGSSQSPFKNVIPAHGSVTAECDGSDVSLSEVHRVTFEETSLRLDYLEDGTNQVKYIETGTFTTRNQTLPMVYDHVRRVLILGSENLLGEGLTHTLTFDSDVRYRVRSPLFYFQGNVELPPFTGNLTWGDWRLDQANATNETLYPHGAFLLTSDLTAYPRWLTIEGASWSPPPVEMETVLAKAKDVGAAWAWGAAAISAAGLGLAGTPRGRVLLVGLFTRLTQSMALQHPRRMALLNAVSAHPGIGIHEAARLLGVAPRIVNYHASALSNQGVLQFRRFGRQTALFVAGTVSASEHERIHRLRQEPVRSLLEQLRINPLQTQTELSAKLGVTQAYVSQLLNELQGMQAVRVEEAGRRRAYHVVPTPALETLGPMN